MMPQSLNIWPFFADIFLWTSKLWNIPRRNLQQTGLRHTHIPTAVSSLCAWLNQVHWGWGILAQWIHNYLGMSWLAAHVLFTRFTAINHLRTVRWIQPRVLTDIFLSCLVKTVHRTWRILQWRDELLLPWTNMKIWPKVVRNCCWWWTRFQFSKSSNDTLHDVLVIASAEPLQKTVFLVIAFLELLLPVVVLPCFTWLEVSRIVTGIRAAVCIIWGSV